MARYTDGGDVMSPAPARDALLETMAMVILVVAVLLLLALASGENGPNLIGAVGAGVREAVTFVVGRYVSFVLPALLIFAAFAVWRGMRNFKTALRVLGLLGIVFTVCSLLAVPYYSVDFRANMSAFEVGGAIGNFLVHAECLNMVGNLGVTGCYLVLGSLLILSASAAADVRLKAFMAAASEWWKVGFWPGLRGRWDAFLNALQNASGGESGDPVVSSSSTVSTAAVPPAAPVRPVNPGDAVVPRLSRLSMAPGQVTAIMTGTSTAPPVATPHGLAAMAHVTGIPAAGSTAMAPAQGAAVGAVMPGRSPEDIQAAREQAADDLVSLAEMRGEQGTMELVPEYQMPSVELLNRSPKSTTSMDENELADISERLEKALSEFGINANVVQVTQGPTVTRFEIQPAPGVKVARIASLENDIAMCMKAESVRIIAPIPGRGTVGLEVPNRKATPVFLREMLETDAFRNHPSPLAFALGMTISGEPYISDLAAMPHVLIAGRTGSGKSVCLNSIICSILFRMGPDKVKFMMIDPKRVELNVYKDIPHLLAPVVCEPRKAAAALEWAVEQMDQRYKKLASLGVRNIDGYNAIAMSDRPHPKAVGRQVDYMPHIVIVIDELADLMIIAKNEVEDSIIRLAQMSRAVGMHLILATQRPSVNVITGIIKANFPSRVAFQVSSKVDSRTILDAMGAESLLGRGDMLFSPGGSPKPLRLQGCYLSDQEVELTADWVRAQGRPSYEKNDFMSKKELEEQRQQMARGEGGLRMDGIDADDSSVAYDGDEDFAGDDDYTYQQERLDGRPVGPMIEPNRMASGSTSRSSTADDSDAIDEELFDQAVKLILTHRKASVSLMQRKLKIGFARAGRVMDMLEERGIVGPNVGSKVRDILVDADEYLAELEEDEKF